MDRLRQLFLSLRRKLLGWLLNVAAGLLVKLAVEEITKMPWRTWGERVNALTDAKVGKDKADPVQRALARGWRAFAEGIEA